MLQSTPLTSPKKPAATLASSSFLKPLSSSGLTSLEPSSIPLAKRLLPSATINPPEDIEMEDGGEEEEGAGGEDDWEDADEGEGTNDIEVGEEGGNGGEGEGSGSSEDEEEDDDEDEDSDGAESEDLEGSPVCFHLFRMIMC